MWNRIIVPLDGSANAEVSISYAQDFAALTGSELVLLFVKEPSDSRSENIISCYLDNMMQKAKGDVAELSKQSGHGELKIRSQILTGNPAEEILDFAENNPDSKILMSVHGQGGTRSRWALGSVTERVVNASTVPVTLIRVDKDPSGMRPKGRLQNILAPVDGSKESEASLPYVRDMALLVKAKVTLLNIISFELGFYRVMDVSQSNQKRKDAEEYLQKLAEDCKKEGIDADILVEEAIGDVSLAINRYTEMHPVDLVIMSTHGHSGFRRWVMGSVTEKVIKEGNTPVMLCRPAGMAKR